MIGFGLLKILSFIPGGGLIKKIGVKTLLIIGAVLIVIFLVWKYTDIIKQAAYDEVFREQVEDVLKNEERERKKLENIIIQRDRSITELQRRQDQIERFNDGTFRDIQSGEFKGSNDPTSELTRRTIERIREQEGLPPIQEPPGRPQDASGGPSGSDTGGDSQNPSVEAWRKRNE